MGAAGVLAAEMGSGTTTVTFSIAEAIEVTSWPAASFTLASDAAPGVPAVSQPLRISVKANSSWGVQISSDSDSGHLREYDTNIGAYGIEGSEVGPVEWALNIDGPWTRLNSMASSILSGQSPTGEEGASRSFILRVTPDFDVRPLPDGRVYRMVLTYTVGVGY